MYLYLRTMIADPLHATTTQPFLIAYVVGEALFIGSIWLPNLAVQQGLIVVSLLIFIGTVMAENGNFDREFRQRQIPFELNSAASCPASRRKACESGTSPGSPSAGWPASC